MFEFEEEVDNNNVLDKLDCISSYDGVISSDKLNDLADELNMSRKKLYNLADDYGYKVED